MSRLASITFLSILTSTPLYAGTFTVFGPQVYVRETGKPIVIEKLFSPYAAGDYTLQIQNGTAANKSLAIASAVVSVNDVQVLVPESFNQNVTDIQKSLALSTSNSIAVEIRAKPAASIRIHITGEDDIPPLISATITPPANAAGWHKHDVQVSFTCQDEFSGIVECPVPVLISSSAAQQIVSGTAVDLAGNKATVSVEVNLDKILPTISGFQSPLANSDGWVNVDTDVSFICDDSLSGVAQCTEPQTVSAEGITEQSGQVVDLAGNIATMTQLVKLDKTVPIITIAAPADGAVVSEPLLQLTGSISDSNDIVIASVNGQPLTLIGNDFSHPVDLVAGLNSVVVNATDIAGNSAIAEISVTLQAQGNVTPQLTITSPLEASTQGDMVTVIGRFSGPANTGVSINGITAELMGARFVAQDVPLFQSGENSLTAIATTPTGDDYQKIIVVNKSANPSSIYTSVSPKTGFAPLDTEISVTSQSTALTIASIAVDFDGNGTVDFTTTDSQTPIEYSYDQVGIHTMTVTVTDSDGATHVVNKTIVAGSASEQDGKLRAIYADMMATLHSGDQEAALQVVSKSTRAKYQEIFAALGNTIIEGTFVDGRMTKNLAEYALLREHNGKKHLSLVYFIRGRDGIWRIEEM